MKQLVSSSVYEFDLLVKHLFCFVLNLELLSSPLIMVGICFAVICRFHEAYIIIYRLSVLILAVE